MQSIEAETNNQLHQAIIRVYPGLAGWNVAESEFSRLLAKFDAKEEALGYAMSLAEAKTHTVVEVYGKGGVLEARSAYQVSQPVF